MATLLRTAQFIETLEAGGAEKLAVDIANELAARGHESHLIVLRADGAFRARVDSRVRYHCLERPRRDGALVARTLYFFGTLRRLVRLLREQRVEVMQTHLPKANFLGLGVGWRKACRVHPTVHNNREFDYGVDSGRLKTFLRKRAYRQMLTKCSAMITVSAKVRDGMIAELQLGRDGSDRIRIVTNGVRIATQPDPVARQCERLKRKIGPDEFLIVGVGRLTRQKGFSSLVAALAAQRAGLGTWRCLIAGEGELRPQLEREIAEAGLQDQVVLAGLEPDVPGLLAAADVFCLPSLYEGLPLVLLEAMSAGVAACAFAIDGVREVIVDGTSGRLVAPGDPSALGEALAALAGRPAEREAMGRAGREVVRAHFDFRQVVDQLEEVYRG